jgi:hypothetical protein
MKSSIRLAVGGASLVLMTGVATAAPIVLDTEQKAAAGVATALSTSRWPIFVNDLVDTAREHTHFALKIVHAATTPVALMSTPGGIAINCSISGTIQARMANVEPRVLRLQAHDCVTRYAGYDKTINGPVAITLPADTFEPQNVLAIRLGNATTEFRLEYRSETAEQNDTITDAYSLALNGDISLARLYNCCEWVGTSSFEMKGYHELLQLIDFPNGAPSTSGRVRLSAQRLTMLRTTNAVDGVNEDDSRYLGGAISYTRSDPPPYGTYTESFRFNDYHVARTNNFNDLTEHVSMDGRVAVESGTLWGAGCMDGLYAFRTRAPLVKSLITNAYSSGQLVANGSVVASFYSSANTPPALPTPVNGMLLSMRVRDLGTFNYDASDAHNALMPMGQCQP